MNQSSLMIRTKNMGATDADKEDVLFECVRQLGTQKLVQKISEEELKNYFRNSKQTKKRC